MISKSRREFLTITSLGVLGTTALSRLHAQNQTQLPPGAPTAYGAGAAFGPEVSTTTFAEAEKLVQFPLTDSERAMAAASWRKTLASVYERRNGPRKLALEDTLAPAAVWDPMLPGLKSVAQHDRFVRSNSSTALPQHDEDIAFSPVTQLSRWVESRQLTSERLTRIYLDRLERFNPKLRCAITITRDLALQQAKQADQEIAQGKYRGPLQGIPWGGKDLLDTAGIPTTYGAEPYRNRIPKDDAAVVKKLRDAGAVLVAKLSMGALALNDIWFGGQTMNPWLPEEGASDRVPGRVPQPPRDLSDFPLEARPGEASSVLPCAAA